VTSSISGPLLSVERLDAYYGPSQVLRGIDLTIARGEAVALMGRNGMGKTTLLRALIGLVPDRRGRIAVGGTDVTRAAPEAIAQMGVAIVPEGRGIFASLTVIENLVMAARAGRDGRRTWTLERVLDLFPRLLERHRNGGGQLSGGEQQMLTIGRALMTNPELLLVDEATEGLAPLIAEEIWRTLAAARAAGLAILVVDKDLRQLAKLCDRALLLAKGEIVFDGTPAALSADRPLLERHLGL
jgi:branched-chain amino acid transport system ATP-binding protein